MRDYKASEIRNVCVLGHTGAGKTTLLEAMLFYTKASDRFGSTKDGSSLIDYDKEEIKRGISIYTSIVPIEWRDVKINFLDTPGFTDYIGEQEAALAVADNALIVVNAKEEIALGTISSWEKVQKKKKPTMFFVNKLDEEGASFDKTYLDLRDTFGKQVIPFEVPIIENNELVGSINILRGKAWYFKTSKASKEVSYDVPEEYKDVVATYKEQIAETVAMLDEEFMERYFSGEPYTEAQLTSGVRIGIRNGDIIPVYSGSALLSQGMERLMDLIIKYFPTYGEQGVLLAHDKKANDLIEIKSDESETFSAQIFKTTIDPFVGKISFLKVYSGVLSNDSVVYNTKKDEQEKIGQIFVVKGKHQTAIGKLFTGDIGAVLKLQHTETNDTLCEVGKSIILDEIAFTKGLLGKCIRPKTKQDDDKVNGAMQKLLEEDKTCTLKHNAETKERILLGVSEQHLDVIVSKLKNKFKVEVELSPPKVAYRETITKAVEAEGRYKKQSGGHGQFGHVFIRFEPNPEQEDMSFEQKVVGGSVPKSYFPAVEAGLEEAMQTGVLAGYNMVNVKATLYDGKYHDVDSSELAFKLAAILAFKEGIPKAGPVLLEPIMNIEIIIPEAYTGTIMGEINKRRGMILGMDVVDNKQVIKGQVPMAEILEFSNDLRSLTQGRGEYSIELERYDAVPEPVVKQIMKQ